jgi:hypothetical protein
MTDPRIVVKTCRADLESYVELQSDLDRFGYKKVLICVPEADLRAFDRLLSPGFELLSADRLLRSFGWPVGLRESWSSQQLFKLLLVAVSDSEVCWVVDSNTLLMEPLPDPWQEGKIVLSVGDLNPFDRRCFESSARFLNLPLRGPAMDPVNQPLRASVVHALFARIARLYPGSPVSTLIMSLYAADRHGIPAWTEYGLYRTFAFHAAEAAHCFGEGTERVGYYDHEQEGERVEEWLGSLKRTSPKMVKVYARRPTYRMDVSEYHRLCERIRANH